MDELVALVKPVVTNVDVALRILAALGLGGIIGFEREISHQPAGLRTHIAVCLGAALFGLISVHGFDAYAQPRLESNYQIDVTRVASQVVVGIGFLGGGAILKQGTGVRGLTTAASLWVTAAIGLAAGIGSFVAAAITTTALLLSLVGLRAPRESIRRRLGRGRGTALIDLAEGADPSGVIQALFSLSNVTVREVTMGKTGKRLTIQADLVGPVGSDLPSVLAPILERDDVTDVEVA